MSPRALIALLVLGLIVGSLSGSWNGGPAVCRAQMPPEQTVTTLKPAEGLEVILFAAEPMVVNPTNIDVDSRGRVWVTEGLNYRLYRNEKGEIVRQQGADRIKILEDTDLDGRADKVTVFAEGITPVPMGLAVEERYDDHGRYLGCRVYVGNSPNLMVFEDTNGDDKADRIEPLLTGFGGIDSDHGVHGMVLALDGKLYFTHGDGCCSVQPDKSQKTQNFDVVDRSGRHVRSDQLANTLRVNRDGTEFEIIADRQRNNYEIALDSFGGMFVSDNDDDGRQGCRIIHVFDGGSYGYRTPGSPRHWGEEVPGNLPKLVGTGNGSPCGLRVCETNALGDRFLGALLEAEAGTRQINVFPLTRMGATYRTTSGETLLRGDDPWFRPVDVTLDHDGSALVADWYDGGVGGHAFQDQTTGRIYRVAPKGWQPSRPSHDFGTPDGLLAALKSPVTATQDAAARALVAQGPAACATVAQLALNGSPIERARALWVWTRIDGLDPAVTLANDPDPRVREQAARILGRDVSRMGDVTFTRPEAQRPLRALERLDDLLTLVDDPDAGVRKEVILALRDLPTNHDGGKVGQALRRLTASWDGQDRWYLEALGLALQHREPAFITDLLGDPRSGAGGVFGPLDLEQTARQGDVALPPYFPADRNDAYLTPEDQFGPVTPLSRSLGLAWRLNRAETAAWVAEVLPSLDHPALRRVAEEILGRASDPAIGVRLARLATNDLTTDPNRARSAIATLASKLGGDWRAARDHQAVSDLITRALATPSLRGDALKLIAATKSPRYVNTLIDLIGGQDPELRADALETLARLSPETARPLVEEALERARGQSASNPLADASARALIRLADSPEKARDRLRDLLTDENLPLGLRREALKSLAGFQQGIDTILDLGRTQALPSELIGEARLILASHPDPRMRQRAAADLPASASKGRDFSDLIELAARNGDAQRGRAQFLAGSQACAGCHRVQGKGEWIGPDLSTIGVKYAKADLLRHILAPNEAIGYNYRTVVVALNDGQILSGLPVEDSAERLILKTADGRRITIPVAEIEERSQSDVSLMPEGLLDQWDDQAIVDLLEYLSSLTATVAVVGELEVVEPNDASSVNRLTANVEGLFDLSSLWATNPNSNQPDAARSVTLRVGLTSPGVQTARLVLDHGPGWRVAVALDGQPLTLDPHSETTLELPAGRVADLTLILKRSPQANDDASRSTLGVAVVADRPVRTTLRRP